MGVDHAAHFALCAFFLAFMLLYFKFCKVGLPLLNFVGRERKLLLNESDGVCCDNVGGWGMAMGRNG